MQCCQILPAVVHMLVTKNVIKESDYGFVASKISLEKRLPFLVNLRRLGSLYQPILDIEGKFFIVFSNDLFPKLSFSMLTTLSLPHHCPFCL